MAEPLVFEAPGASHSLKKAWERQEGEPARWYMRFKRYLAMGHRRAVNAVYELEKQEKAEKSRGKAGETWYHAAKLYKWAERAAAYDDEVETQKAQAMRVMAARSPFVSSAYRLWQLNSLADSVARLIEQGQPVDLFLPLCKQLQSLMHDITAELAVSPLDLATVCDAAALDATVAKLQRLADLQAEREAEEDFQLDQKIAAAMARGLL